MWTVAGILSGWLSDKYGPAPIGCATLLLSLPWYGLITIDGSLAMFLIFFALEGEHESIISMRPFPLITADPIVFFASGLISPIMLELSSTSRIIEGIGCTPFTLDA